MGLQTPTKENISLKRFQIPSSSRDCQQDTTEEENFLYIHNAPIISQKQNTYTTMK